MNENYNKITKRLALIRNYLRAAVAWRQTAIGVAIGLTISAILDIGLFFDWWYIKPLLLIIPPAVGLLYGIIYALFKPITENSLAKMVDSRAKLKDRALTTLERHGKDGAFDAQLLDDTANRLDQLEPKKLFPLRFARPQAALCCAGSIFLIAHLLPFMPFINTPEKQKEQAETAQIAGQAERIAKPLIEAAKDPNASDLEKQIAKNLNEFKNLSEQGRLDKKEALQKYNEILDQADKLNKQSKEELANNTLKMETAGKTLTNGGDVGKELDRELASLNTDMNNMQKELQSGKSSDGAPLNPEQMAALQKQMEQMGKTMNAAKTPGADADKQMAELQKELEQLQKQMDSGKNDQGMPLSKEQIEQLKKKAESLKKQIRALKLSKEAQEFMKKLMNDPSMMEAMKRMQELSKKSKQASDPNKQLSETELAELEKQLAEFEKQMEELAKKYKDDEQIKELAKQILEQVKKMKENTSECKSCVGLMGLGSQQGMCSLAGTGISTSGKDWQPADFDKNDWANQPETFNQGDTQTMLNIPYKDLYAKGQNPLSMEDTPFTEFLGAPTAGVSSIPLSALLPSYTRQAESALDKDNIPPSERKRVKKYFESLRQ